MNDKLHYLNKKDYYLRKNFSKNELFTYLLQAFIYDTRLLVRYRFFLKNKILNKTNLRLTLIRSRCLLNGRSRFVFKYFNLNRNSLKFAASFGFISGFKKY